jgi:predicted ArsR family transcriptional regulator
MSKTREFLSALKTGQRMTAKQAVQRFDFVSEDAVRAQVSKLRFSGYPIYANRETNRLGDTYTKYRLGTASREVIAAGYRALASGNA